MVRRRQRLTLSLFALLVLGWMVVEAATGAQTGLLYLAPAVVLCAPLLAGRYVGECRLAELASTPRRARRVPPRVPMPASHVRVMQRGGRLVACGLAKRPPPACAAQLTA